MIVMYMDAALTAAPWRDPKKYAWPLAVLVPALPFTSFAAWPGDPGAWWIAPVVVFGVMAAVEAAASATTGPTRPRRRCQRLAARCPTTLANVFSTCRPNTAALVLCCAVWVRGGLVVDRGRPGGSPSASSTGSPSTPRMSWATSARRSSAGCRGDRARRHRLRALLR